MEDIRKAQKRWEASHAQEFEQERKKEFATRGGITIKRCYTPSDLADTNFDYSKDLGFPGEYPFTRGISSNMYRRNLWTMVVTTGRPTPEDANKLWKEHVNAAGMDSITIQYDLPSALGYDPDHPLAEGEVGRVGLALTSQRDWEIAFNGIDLSRIRIIQFYNALAPIGVANHQLIGEKQGVDFKNLRGNILNDVLKEYTARGTYIFPPEHGLRVTLDTVEYCVQNNPGYQPLLVTCYHFHEKGADTIQEIAFMLANAFTYLEKAVERGIDVDAVAPLLTFGIPCNHHNFFEDIAKIRAARRMYARTMRERFKAKKPESLKMRQLSSNGGSALYRPQYLNNIARGTVAALAAALGGATNISVRPYDEAFGTPTEESMMNTLQIQRVVAEETGVTDTVDPLAGSYFVESLTSEIEERVSKELDTIDKQGGALRCIENGYIEKAIVASAYKWQKAFEAGEVVRVGVNRYTSIEEQRPSRIYRADPEVEKQRIEAVRELKQKRDNRKVKRALDDIGAVARLKPTRDNNLVPPTIAALRVYATVGEIADAMRGAWGEFRRPYPL